MAMALTGVGPALEPFDQEGPAHEVSARWRRWKRSVQYYMDGKNITSAKRQRSLLLYLTGMPVQEKFETLTEDEDTDNLFERAVSALDKAFEFVANKKFERYKLRQMSQWSGETREVLHNENSNEVSRPALRKCVRIFARTLCSGYFRSLHAPSERTTCRHDPIGRFRSTIFRAKIRRGATDFLYLVFEQ